MLGNQPKPVQLRNQLSGFFRCLSIKKNLGLISYSDVPDKVNSVISNND